MPDSISRFREADRLVRDEPDAERRDERERDERGDLDGDRHER